MAQCYDTRTVWFYTCDRCGDRSPEHGHRLNLDKHCEAIGWRLHGGEDVCPDCVQAEEHEEELAPGETGIY